MIVVKVKAIMELAAALGRREQAITLPEGSRVCDLLATMENIYGQPFSEILHRDDISKTHPNLVFLLNGSNVIFLDGFETRLKDGDELFFLSPIGGG